MFNAALSSVLALYSSEYIHIVHNTGDPAYGTDIEKKKDHIIQHNNFAVGAFASASRWMENFRPDGNFVILQHSVNMVAKVKPPACDIELVNLKQRCGGGCRNPTNYQKMLTGLGTASCFGILNEMMTLYNTTCAFPCCPWSQDMVDSRMRHIEYWPFMAHNAILFTARARDFLQPLKEHVESMPPGYVGKKGDQGTERLFGLFSTMLLEKYGSIWDKSTSIAQSEGVNLYYSNPLEAYKHQTFACSQDLTTKRHGNLG